MRYLQSKSQEPLILLDLLIRVIFSECGIKMESPCAPVEKVHPTDECWPFVPSGSPRSLRRPFNGLVLLVFCDIANKKSLVNKASYEKPQQVSVRASFFLCGWPCWKILHDLCICENMKKKNNWPKNEDTRAGEGPFLFIFFASQQSMTLLDFISTLEEMALLVQTHPAVRWCVRCLLEVIVTGKRNERCHEENANSGRLHLSALASFPGGLYGLRHACLNVCILRATGMDQGIREDLLHWLFFYSSSGNVCKQ